jgi:DME family drug/metabolite transporter
MLSGSAATGALFALGSAVCYGVFTVTSRHLAQRYHPLQSITVGFAVGSLMLLILALLTGFETRYDTQGWAMLVYLGSVPSALAYSLFLIGMRSVTATLASISMLMEPLTAAVLAWLLFGERLGPLGFAGAALLLGAIGVMFVSQRQPEAVTTHSG